MKETFGNILKASRRSKNISQRDLADAVGCDFTYISKLENDRLPPPAADTVKKISEVLEIPSEILLAHSGKVSSEIKDVMSNPEAIKFIQEVHQMNLSEEEWKSLHSQLKSLR
ncbi:MAG: helix-turn-helix transcriptional regulator [Agriterribacter sp.]